MRPHRRVTPYLESGSSTCSRGLRFNNEVSDNCGNSTRSEIIVINSHSHKDFLSTVNGLNIPGIIMMFTSLYFPNSDSVWKLPVRLKMVWCVIWRREKVKYCWYMLRTVRRKHCKCRSKYKSQFSLSLGMRSVEGVPGIWLYVVIWNLHRSMQIIAIFNLKSSQRGRLLRHHLSNCPCQEAWLRTYIFVAHASESEEWNDRLCSSWQIICVYLLDSECLFSRIFKVTLWSSLKEQSKRWKKLFLPKSQLSGKYPGCH